MNKIVPEETLHKIGDSLNKFKHDATRALVNGFDILQTGTVYIWSGFSRFISKKTSVVSQFPNPVEAVPGSVEAVPGSVEAVPSAIDLVSVSASATADLVSVPDSVEAVSATVEPVSVAEAVPNFVSVVIESKDESSSPTSI